MCQRSDAWQTSGDIADQCKAAELVLASLAAGSTGTELRMPFTVERDSPSPGVALTEAKRRRIEVAANRGQQRQDRQGCAVGLRERALQALFEEMSERLSWHTSTQTQSRCIAPHNHSALPYKHAIAGEPWPVWQELVA